MTAFTVRDWQPGDLQDLREIFAASFGDPPEIIDAFHRAFLSAPDRCTVAAVPDANRPEGRAVAAGYMLPGPVLRFPDRVDLPTAYVYAVGCLPAWRRRGFGSEIYRALLARGKSMAPVTSVIPSSENLVHLYGRVCPIIPLGSSRFAEMDALQAVGAEAPVMERISGEAYALRREEWLAPYPHASYSPAFYRLMEEYDNLFLALPGALATVIQLEDRCVLSELLFSGADPARAIAGVAAVCPADRYEIRTPVFLPGPGKVRRFAYCHPADDSLTPPDSFWFPFGLE